MDIQSVSSSPQPKSGDAALGLAEDFNSFLTLLTTQLQNQDPLSPVDSTQFTEQLVQFTSVEQAVATNDKLDSLLSAMTSNTMTQAVGYVGTFVVADGQHVELGQTGEASMRFELADDVSQATLTVQDQDGQIVHTADIVPTPGEQAYFWDGRNEIGQRQPAGSYQVRVDALDGGGLPTTVKTQVGGTVQSVDIVDGALKLVVGGRPVPIEAVRSVTLPSSSDQTAQ
ncbi:MAG: flagellar hook assembly protein FlgD [Geminicoccaceae bacterium]